MFGKRRPTVAELRAELERTKLELARANAALDERIDLCSQLVQALVDWNTWAGCMKPNHDIH